MKVKVIGSGSMWTKYNSACYLIDEDIMVDFPNGACKYLYRQNIKPSSVSKILLTHFHGDHYFDIPFLILNKSKSDNKKTFIYCSKEGKSKIKKIGFLAFPNSFIDACKEINLEFNFNNNFVLNNYKVEKILVDHGRMKPAYGYIFNENEKYIGFTGDTSLCKNTEIMAEKCCYLFCDCMFIKGNSKHMGIDNLKYLANNHPSCTFVVSHLEDETRNMLEVLKIKNIIIPEDGQEIIID